MSKRDNKNYKMHSILLGAICFFITIAIIEIIFAILHIVPFGNQSIIMYDASVQYNDFFKFYKDLLTGDASLKYTLSNLLGGDTLAVFTYYLCSPFNLLMVFFEKDQIQLFFTLIYALKIGTAAFTMSLFLRERFDNKINDLLVVLLSISYGLMHYNLNQAFNIMWLDGVYMLPLILLGVYRVIKNKDLKLLTISVGLAIIFNWYAAGIGCLFSILWFILEFFLQVSDNSKKASSNFKDLISKGFTYVFGMGMGVLISFVTFLPSVITILNGKGMSKEVPAGLTGSLSTIINSFYISGDADIGKPAFFCGAVVLLGVIGLFITKMVSTKKKIVIGAILLISLSSYYVNKIYLLFSLLNYATSYYYRFSFVTIFLLIFASALFYTSIDKSKDKNWNIKLILGAVLYGIIIIGYNCYKNFSETQYPILSAIFVLITAIVIILIFNQIKVNKVLSIILSLILFTELGINAAYLFKYNYTKDITEFESAYTDNITTQVNNIKQIDNSNFRISQTSYRVPVSYNEGLAYNFWSNATYTSCPINTQLNFLNNLGYKTEGGCISNVKTSIVSADSLLGVKYVLSEFPINGLILRDDLGVYNNKSVYENPYAMPMAYKINDFQPEGIADVNPFEYQNLLFSQLANEDVKLFEPIPYTQTNHDGYIEYQISIPEGNYSAYGNIPYYCWFNNSKLIFNNNQTTPYACWMSETVFYLHDNDKYKNYNLKLKVDDNSQIATPQFYSLDLDKLQKITDKIKANEIIVDDLGSSNLDFTIDANSNESLILSISNSDAWNIKVNDINIKCQELGDCFVAIPLVEGQNHITMDYEIPGLKFGAIITLCSIGVFAIYSIISVNYNKKNHKNI